MLNVSGHEGKNGRVRFGRKEKNMKHMIYVGSRTTRERNARGNGIEVYESDYSTGIWKHLQTVEGLENPSYLCMDKTHQYMYTVHGDQRKASALRIDRESGRLTLINTVDTQGQNPVYLLPDKSNRFILIACLGTENIVAVERNEDGSLGQVAFNHHLPGAEEGKNSCPHQIFYDREEKYLIVSAKGGRNITTGAKTGMNVFTFSPEDGFRLVYSLGGRNLDECRHVAVHPNNRFVYQVNERRNVVISWVLNNETGEMTPFQTSQTLPDDCADPKLILASGIAITKDGRFVYVSNRGHDSVAMYEADPVSGKLSPLGFVPSMGDFPRFLGLDPESRFLYVANERSDNIAQYEVQKNGSLVLTNQEIKTGSPVCILFADL